MRNDDKPKDKYRARTSTITPRGAAPWLLGAALATLSACGVGEDGDLGPEGLGGGVENARGPIINGNTTNLPYYRVRTVHVRTPGGGTCSGTLMLPDVVLTARHCVTTNGTIGGTIAAATAVRARILALAPGPASPDVCTGSMRHVTCARGSSISNLGGTGSDAVLIRLENPIRESNNVSPVFTPLELGGAAADYLGDSLIVTGWGRDTCAGGGGVLRDGAMNLQAVGASASIGGTTYTRLNRLAPGTANEGLWLGDSGGPTWGTTRPPAVIGVHSASSCSGTATPRDGHDWSAHENEATLRNILWHMTPPSTFADLSSTSQVMFPSPQGWQIVGGRLKQTMNLGHNVALLAGSAWQRIVDHRYEVKVQGSDNDDSGIAFSYFSSGDYLRCEASEQTGRVRLVARRLGEELVLSSTPWAGDYASVVTFTVTARRNGNAYPFTCQVSGGGTSTVTVSGSHDELAAGEAGVFNNFNEDTSYWDFRVTRL